MITEELNHRVSKFTKDGRYIYRAGEAKGTEEGEFNHPWGIAIGRSCGDVYVADWHNDRIQKFSSDGNVSGELRKFGRRSWGVEAAQ